MGPSGWPRAEGPSCRPRPTPNTPRYATPRSFALAACLHLGVGRSRAEREKTSHPEHLFTTPFPSLLPFLSLEPYDAQRRTKTHCPEICNGLRIFFFGRYFETYHKVAALEWHISYYHFQYPCLLRIFKSWDFWFGSLILGAPRPSLGYYDCSRLTRPRTWPRFWVSVFSVLCTLNV